MGDKKKGFFGRLVEGLTKTRDSIVSGIDSVFSGFSAIDDDFYEEIEETLIMGDLGIQTTMAIVEDLRKKVKENHIRRSLHSAGSLILFSFTFSLRFSMIASVALTPISPMIRISSISS